MVIELEIKRRDNDRKVNLLFLEMRNMMTALLQCVCYMFGPLVTFANHHLAYRASDQTMSALAVLPSKSDCPVS